MKTQTWALSEHVHPVFVPILKSLFPPQDYGLLPCPFCGSEAKWLSNLRVFHDANREYHTVYCSNDDCGAKVGSGWLDDYETARKTAWKHWNTRCEIEEVCE